MGSLQTKECKFQNSYVAFVICFMKKKEGEKEGEERGKMKRKKKKRKRK